MSTLEKISKLSFTSLKQYNDIRKSLIDAIFNEAKKTNDTTEISLLLRDLQDECQGAGSIRTYEELDDLFEKIKEDSISVTEAERELRKIIQ